MAGTGWSPRGRWGGKTASNPGLRVRKGKTPRRRAVEAHLLRKTKRDTKASRLEIAETADTVGRDVRCLRLRDDGEQRTLGGEWQYLRNFGTSLQRNGRVSAIFHRMNANGGSAGYPSTTTPAPRTKYCARWGHRRLGPTSCLNGVNREHGRRPVAGLKHPRRVAGEGPHRSQGLISHQSFPRDGFSEMHGWCP